MTLQSYQSLGNKPALEKGQRGQNKVSALAKDLAIKFSGDSAPPPAKKEAMENKAADVEKVGLKCVHLRKQSNCTILVLHTM